MPSVEQGCLVARPGIGGTRRTPCEKDEAPTNCQNCPFWNGAVENFAPGTRGGETPMESAAWRKIRWANGLPGGDS